MTVVARKTQKYGWIPDLPDHRDKIFNEEHVILGANMVPTRWDLTDKMPLVWDQGNLGSCTGHGVAAVVEHAETSEGQAPQVPSRLFIYYNERVIEGTVSTDAGAQIRDGIKVMVNTGAPPETYWPYDITQFATVPPKAAYDAASVHKALVYKRVRVGGPGAPLRTAISQGYPIVLGFSVPDYFENGSWDPVHRPLPVATPQASIIGGHCVVLVGYDFTSTRFPVPVFKARNSWSANWGDMGHFYFDYRWFTSNESLASDMWTIMKVS